MEKRNFSGGSTTADTRWGKLSLSITEVVNSLLRKKDISQAVLCKKVDYAQSVISKTLSGKQRWSFTLLLLVADALGVSMSSIIAAAEDESALSALRYAGTQPRSEERLNAIVRSIAPPGTTKEVLDLLYSAAMLRIAVPQLVKGYFTGEIADDKLYLFLKETADSVVDDENFLGKVQLRFDEMGDQLK